MKKSVIILMIGLLAILAASAVQSCTRAMLHVSDNTEATMNAGSPYGTTVIDATEVGAIDKVSTVVDTGIGELKDWHNWVALAMLLFASLFGALFQRARSVISEIDDALDDGKISSDELKSIIATWKRKTLV